MMKKKQHGAQTVIGFTRLCNREDWGVMVPKIVKSVVLKRTKKVDNEC